MQVLKVPLYSTGGTTDAIHVDVQAAYESAMSSLLVAMSGANYIHDIAGLMEADLTVSYEKLVLDNEILGMCQRVLRGIEVNDDTLGTDMIIQKGPCSDYMTEDHTIRYMRSEFFVPELSSRQKRETLSPGNEAMDRAKTYVKELTTRSVVSCMDSAMRQKILETYPQINNL